MTPGLSYPATNKPAKAGLFAFRCKKRIRLAMPEPASSHGHRWWENYAIRYLVPTMTGMLFLRWLQLSAGHLFSSILPAAGQPQSHPFQGLDVPELLIWAGSGFTFAYLSSLPILVFHATRPLDSENSATRGCFFRPLMASILLIGAAALLILLKHVSVDGGLYAAAGAVLIVLAFSSFQGHRIWHASRPDFRAEKFAWAIASARVSGGVWKTGQEINEYVTSYRHLREHGNAAFIVLLQAALCALLYICLTASKDEGKWGSWTSSQWIAYGLALLLLVLWIVPSVAIHSFSQKLEAGLIFNRPSPAASEPAAPTDRSGVLPAAPPAQAPAAPSPSPATAAQRFKARVRILKTVSQFSPWLLPLAFCPPVLILWNHSNDLHYPSLVMLAISGTAGLGTLLLLGSLMWLLWTLSLALPSLLVAMVTSAYGPSRVPRRLALAWTLLCLAAAGWTYTVIQLSATPPPWLLVLFYIAPALLIGLAVASSPPDAIAPSKIGSVQRRNTFLVGIPAFFIALMVLFLLLLPFFLMSRAYGKEPDSILLVVGVVAFTFLGALVPGILFTWSNRKSKPADREPMSIGTFAGILLIPPFLSFILLTALKQQVNYLTLVSSGIVDKGGDTARPSLYRLPDKWTDQDRLLINSFPPLSLCAKTVTSQPEPAAWVCGYRNFSFGATQLVCDKPYSDEIGRFTEAPLTCLTLVGNQIVNLTNLPRPGRVQ